MPSNRTPPPAPARLAQGDQRDPGPQEPAGAGEHPTRRQWRVWIDGIDALIRKAAIDPSQTLVLVPYAQLMDAGRRAWAEAHLNGFSPRFESTRNWAASLQPFAPGPTDLSMDMARDSLVAAAFIDRVAQGRPDASMRAVMVARLVEAARQLAPMVASVPPDQRAAWAEPLREVLAPGLQSLHWESMLGSLALAWASTSTYATDVLWSPLARTGSGVHTLIVLQGFQQDPLASALARHWGAQGAELPLPHEAHPAMASADLHACGDAEDEAQRATACVITRVNAAQVPVALVANDRLLTRRVSAMLHGAGLSVRDETGWKLSTTHAAAQLMSLLRAADARARMDDVLDLLKQFPAWPEAQVQALEQLAREAGVSLWRTALLSPRLVPALPEGLPALLEGLQPARPLVAWLESLALALAQCGLWDHLASDPAGQQMIQALRLDEGAAQELVSVTDALAATASDGTTPARTAARSGARLSLSGFTAWVRDVLEGASFMPRGEGEPDVVILPMAQLLGRAFAATVVPGCDEMHLNPSPEPPGQWTATQREALGLPTRDVLALAAAQAWQATLALPQLDVLWRTQ
jgi:ATP-dependent helicase/nuclease subunit B